MKIVEFKMTNLLKAKLVRKSERPLLGFQAVCMCVCVCVCELILATYVGPFLA